MRRLLKPVLWGLMAFAGGMAGSWIGEPTRSEAGMIDLLGGQRVIGTFGVGGVITEDGGLWQYRPDKGAWLTLDESFALEGQATSVSPLPVPPAQIRHMETFGFLVDTSDRCWLYDIEEKVWNEIGSPLEN